LAAIKEAKVIGNSRPHGRHYRRNPDEPRADGFPP
jgi:hypothetical protein